jgi:hypothetical protein
VAAVRDARLLHLRRRHDRHVSGTAGRGDCRSDFLSGAVGVGPDDGAARNPSSSGAAALVRHAGQNGRGSQPSR